MSNDYIYYVYAYIDASSGLPYYIGKGKNGRAFANHGHVIVPLKSHIVFLETNLSELGALALERRYIRWYGREDTHTGILKNKTDGGESTSGSVRVDASKRMRENNPMKRPEVASKISAYRKGKSSWNKGVHNSDAKERMLRNNPMKDPALVAKMVAARSPESSGKGMKWVANVETGKRARMNVTDIAYPWILLSNKKPLPQEHAMHS